MLHQTAQTINKIKKQHIDDEYIKSFISPNYGRFEQLTYEEIAYEVAMCKNVETLEGFLYFALNFGVLEHTTLGAVSVKDCAYHWQIKAAKLYLCSEQIISKKTRQVGFSAFTGLYALWRALFFESQNICIVSISSRESRTFLNRIKFSYDHLPYWMRQEKIEDKKTSFTFESNKSKITSLPMTSDPARGESVSLLILDEFAAYKNAEDVLASSIPALASGTGFLFTNNSLPSQFFIISTYPVNPVGNEYLRILNEARTNPDAGMLVVEVETDDIRHYKDKEWHKKQLAILGERRYNTEIKGLEPSESENAFLSEDVLLELTPQSPIRCDFLFPEAVDEEGYPIEMQEIETMRTSYDVKYGYMRGLWIWQDPIPGKQYVQVCDIASGRHGDHSAFIIFDPDTNEQVAEFYSNRIDTETFKEIVWETCKYYNYAKLSIENTGLGLPLCDYFANTLMYENFFFMPRRKHELVPGFNMNVVTRANGIAFLGASMQKREFKLNSLRLIQELRAFGYDKNGRIQALGNAHDDLVMCLVQYAWLQQHGWAASDTKIENSMIFGNSDNEIISDEEVNEIKKHKYWELNFDINISTLSPEQLELLEILKANGDPLTPEIIAHLNNDNDYY